MSPAYFKDSLGIVHLRGMARSGTGNIFVLPVGYRPAAVGYFPGVSASNPGIVSVDQSGIVKQDGGSNGYLSFDGVHFKAEN